jgi:tetratricopeptide (TPR) repeat protein
VSEKAGWWAKVIVRNMVAGAVAVLAILAGLCPVRAQSGDPTILKRNDRVSYLVHLLDQQRYAEAAQGVQQLFLDCPNDAGSFEVRGVLRLHVGAVKDAEKDFDDAREMADPADPLPAYGLALCAISMRDFDTASKMLANAATVATPAQQDDITIARAVLASATGDDTDAIQLAGAIDTPAAREIVALASYDKSPADGLPLVERFVADGVINDIPRVTEDTGLRYVGSGAKNGSVIEPSLTESILQNMFAQRLDPATVQAQADRNNVVMGVTAIGPVGNLFAQTGETDLVVTTSIDDHLLGMANTQPFQMSWDTRKVTNGVHLIKFEVSDSHGAILLTQLRKVKIANPGDVPTQSSELFPADIADGLWNLLTIHPAYKAAEYTLAQAYLAAKDRSRAAYHIVVAAALDSEYRNVGDQIGQYFESSSREPFQVSTAVYNTPVRGAETRLSELWSGSTKLREVALTFDDGPSPQVTPTLLEKRRYLVPSLLSEFGRPLLLTSSAPCNPAVTKWKTTRTHILISIRPFLSTYWKSICAMELSFVRSPVDGPGSCALPEEIAIRKLWNWPTSAA